MKLALWLQRYSTGLDTSGVIRWVIIFVAVIVGGGLLVWGVNKIIAAFVPAEAQQKVQAVFYAVIAIALAILVFHWAGMV